MDKGKKIAIIGSGLIGKSWAMLFASGGYHVTLYDVDKCQVDAALADIQKQLNELEAGGQLKGSLSAKEQFQLISASGSLAEALKDTYYLQECVPENLDIKKAVYNDIDKLCDDSIILASSTSGIPASKIGSHLNHRKQLLVSHPINPPYYVPLVEVVPAPFTDPEITAKTKALLKDIGQVPVVFKKELDGFIVPRVQAVIVQEGMKLIQDGYIEAEDFDNIMCHGLGLRYAFIGPFETCHLNANGMKEFCERYGEAMYKRTTDPRPPLKWEGPNVEPVNEYLYRAVPLDQLQQRREWRDQSIAKLAKLKIEDNKQGGK